MPPVPPAWADRWLAWRNRLVASPRFQRWAAGFPLTRRIADAYQRFVNHDFVGQYMKRYVEGAEARAF